MNPSETAIHREENERLAVLENQYRSLQTDVTEIKGDVKEMKSQISQLALALAVKEATDKRREQSLSAMGVWWRSLVPWILTGAALILGIVNYANR